MSKIKLETDFSYTPLDPTQRQIRLLKLLPKDSASWQTTIDCEIFIVNLDDLPVYEALSYVWGSENKPFDLRIDGKSLPVTSNLFSALIHIRADGPRTLWVDAICIDQSSFIERDHQVAMMRDIYSGAFNTTVWLGEFSFLPIRGDGNFLRYISKCTQDPSHHAPPDANESAVSANTRKIVDSAWFTRIWIVQELACSEHVEVQIANEKILWEVLLEWNVWFFDPNRNRQLFEAQPELTANERLFNIFVLDRKRNAHRRGELIRLLDLVFDFRAFAWTKDLDMVYALVGIASAQSNAGPYMPIKYDLNFGAMRTNLMHHHSLTNRVFDTLQSSGVVEHMESDRVRQLTQAECEKLLLHPTEEPPAHTSELLCLFPLPPYAPFQQCWMLEPPPGHAAHVQVPANSVPYVCGWLVGYNLTPIGWVQLIYTNEGINPPLFLLLIQATPISFYCIEAFRTSTYHEDQIAKRLTAFMTACTETENSSVIKEWATGVVPTILTARFGDHMFPTQERPVSGKPFLSETMMSKEQLDLWNKLMAPSVEWTVISRDGYLLQHKAGTWPGFNIGEHGMRKEVEMRMVNKAAKNAPRVSEAEKLGEYPWPDALDPTSERF